MTETDGERETAGGRADELLVGLFTDFDVRADPYPSYRELRGLAPVHHSSVLPLWVLSRFDDCATVLRDQRFGKSDEAQRIFGSAADAADRGRHGRGDDRGRSRCGDRTRRRPRPGGARQQRRHYQGRLVCAHV